MFELNDLLAKLSEFSLGVGQSNSEGRIVQFDVAFLVLQAFHLLALPLSG